MYGQGMGFTNWLCGAGGFMPGPLGMIVTVLFWGLLIGVVVKLFQYFFTSKKQDTSSTAFSILKDRYASGDLTKVEFEQMKKDIA